MAFPCAANMLLRNYSFTHYNYMNAAKVLSYELSQ